jgi:hypothetical protein
MAATAAEGHGEPGVAEADIHTAYYSQVGPVARFAPHSTGPVPPKDLMKRIQSLRLGETRSDLKDLSPNATIPDSLAADPENMPGAIPADPARDEPRGIGLPPAIRSPPKDPDAEPDGTPSAFPPKDQPPALPANTVAPKDLDTEPNIVPPIATNDQLPVLPADTVASKDPDAEPGGVAPSIETKDQLPAPPVSTIAPKDPELDIGAVHFGSFLTDIEGVGESKHDQPTPLQCERPPAHLAEPKVPLPAWFFAGDVLYH